MSGDEGGDDDVDYGASSHQGGLRLADGTNRMNAVGWRRSRWIVSAGLALNLVIVSKQTAQAASVHDPILLRRWPASFDIPLPTGVGSEELGQRCWTQAALDSYVTQGRLWIEDVYGLPYDYVGTHCLREQLGRADAVLNAAYRRLLRALPKTDRGKLIADERAWVARRNVRCNVPDGSTYVMLGSFVCLMNMTTDRIGWIEAQAKPRG